MKAVLVFCEGRHDAVFAQRSLGTHAGCQWVNTPIGELPTPFGRNNVARKGFIAGWLERRAHEDLSVRAAAHPSEPRFEAIIKNVTTDTIFVIISTQGKKKPRLVVSLLRALDDILRPPPSTFDISEYAAAFLFDANSEGVKATLQGFGDQYRELFGDLVGLRHNRWTTSETVPVGCFVFHKDAQEPTGTLEDHLAPMVKGAWPNRFLEAEGFIDEKRRESDKVSNSESERLKAIITAAGQFDHPGDPMSIIIGRNGIPTAAFEKSQTSKSLSRFLTQIPWRAPLKTGSSVPSV